MGRVLAALARPLHSSEGLHRELFAAGDRHGLLDAFGAVWAHPAIEVLHARFDEATTGKPGGFLYKRSSLFGIVLMADMLGVSDAESRRTVQGFPELRRLLGFPVDEIEYERLRSTAKPGEIREPGFPSRQTVSDFKNRWARESQFPVAALIREAVQTVAVDVILEHDLDPTKIAVDGAVVLSPNRRPSSKRPDEGADWLMREDQKAMYGRQRMSATLVDSGLVLCSRVEPPQGESPKAQEMIPELKALSDRLVKDAAGRGISHPGFKHAAVFGDSAFANTPVALTLIENDFEPCFETRGWPDRHLIGDMQLKTVGGHVVYDLADDGTFFCDCDRYQNAHTAKLGETLRRNTLDRRLPMRQFKGVTGSYGYVACENPTCPRHRIQVYFPMGVGPDMVKNGRRSRGDTNHTITQTLPRCDAGVQAIMFLGRQYNEHNHQLLERRGLLGKKRHSKRRRIYGNTAHEICYAIGDLYLNITIALNLANRIEPRRVLAEDELVASKQANAAAVKERKARAKKGKNASPPRKAKAPPPALAMAS